MRKILIFCFIIHLILSGVLYSKDIYQNELVCNNEKGANTFIRLCNSIDDVLCNKIPDHHRRSCEERDKTIVHADMSRIEIGIFAVACFKSAVNTAEKFFTEFIPELFKAMWDISKKIINTNLDTSSWDIVKGAYESSKSFSADLYEAIHENPGKFFKKIWDKVSDAIEPMISNYDCLKPELKIEKICGIATSLLFPPVQMALLLVKGTKGLKLFKNESKTLETSRSELKILFNRYRELGYSIEDLKLIKTNNNLTTIELKKLKSLSTEEGQAQYMILTGKSLSLAPAKSLNTLSDFSEHALKRKIKMERKDPKYFTKINLNDDQKIVLASYKTSYAKQVEISDDQSAQFIEKMKIDNLNPDAKVLYFDVENSLQKKLNDDVFGDKDVVNSLNNSFFTRFNNEVSNNKELLKYIDGKYKDYKSLRLRLKYSTEEERLKLEQILADAYKKSNDEFTKDLMDRSINKIIPPETSGIANTSSWFLAGSGNNALEANLAARSARKVNSSPGTLSLYRHHTDTLHGELDQIKSLQSLLASKPNLLSSGVTENYEGSVTLSKTMINILRKIKHKEFKSDELYFDKIRRTVSVKLGTQLDNKTIMELSEYFAKVDSISPPLFSGKRVLVDLAEAENGIISVDFVGIGANNIYNQMKKLTEVNLSMTKKEIDLKESYQKMQMGIEKVSDEMGSAKNSFSTTVSGIDGSGTKSHLFSGDDGIYMPKEKIWPDENKVKLVQLLSTTGDASKYRITFVSTRFSDGKILPVKDRSLAVVRAESVEKELREKMVSVKKINETEAMKIITAIDYLPQGKGGVFNLIVGGKPFSADEKIFIIKSFTSVLSRKNGEKVGKIIFSEPIHNID